MAEGKFGSNRAKGTVIEGNFGSNRTKKPSSAKPKAKAETNPAPNKKRGRPKKESN